MLKPIAIKKLHRLVGLTGILLTLLLAGSCATDTYKYLQQGHKYAAAGEWDNSVRFFQKAHEEDPDAAFVRGLAIEGLPGQLLRDGRLGDLDRRIQRIDDAAES